MTRSADDSARTAEPTSAKLGPFRLHSLETGRFRLDAGAMLGVVPKALWSRVVEIDEKNRMWMASRSLLIRSEETGRTYLVDNGCGDKFNEKMSSIYALDFEHSSLEASLAAVGVAPEEITDLVFTHLHFDHCGGTTFYDDRGELAHRFPNARYHVSEEHLETVRRPNARERASFLKENVEPIISSGRLRPVKEGHQFEPGLYTLPAHGHTDGMMQPVVEHGDTTLVHAADLVPTRHHLPLVWIMGFDMHAAQTLREKEPFLERAIDRKWILYMQHDPDVELITVTREKGKFAMDRSFTLDDLPG